LTTSDEFLSIETPENVAFGYEVAGIGSRFLAALIDSLLIIALLIVVALVGSLFSNMLLAGVEQSESLVLWVVGALLLIAFVIVWGYYIVFELLWNGQSPGKRVFNLRVIRSDGRPITLSESLVRNLVRLVDFMPSSYAIGVVTMFLTSQSQRLGDMAAGTLVIYDQGEVTLDSLRPRTGGTPAVRMQVNEATGEREPVLPDVPVQRLTDQDARLIEEYLRRRYQLANSYTLAKEVAAAASKRMGIAPPEMMLHTEIVTWLALVLEAYRQRGR
jgi:uncharacterized RDD family membrane protein YckC